MTTEIVEFYFDFLSPYSYLAYLILRDKIIKKSPSASASNTICLKFKPVSLPHLIKWSGNSPPASLKPRALFILKDLHRSMKLSALADQANFKVPERFPFDTRNEMYELVKMVEVDGKSFEEIDEFVMKTWRRIFHEGITETFNEISEQRDELKSLLLKNTKEALELGAFGVPFWRITNSAGRRETFFGSDRFNHIDAFLNNKL